MNVRLKTWIIESHKDYASSSRQLGNGKLLLIREQINLGRASWPAYHLTFRINTNGRRCYCQSMIAAHIQLSDSQTMVFPNYARQTNSEAELDA